MTAAPSLAAYLDDLRREIEDGLNHALALSAAPPLVTEAMRYSLLAGGKRLRPCLTLSAAEAAGAPVEIAPADARAMAMPAALAIEMIHTYSLIHDDLPAMDDDALRRGRPTSHVVHGEGMAILAGDALLTEAFRVLAGPPPAPPVAIPPNDLKASRAENERRVLAIADQVRRLHATRRLAAAAGAAGMVGGQAIDLAGAGRVAGVNAPITTAAALEDMHARKTGALIRAAATLGAVMVGAPENIVAAIDDYARDLGLAFQIVDDVLDVEGSNEALGKTAGKDAASGKPTYPAFFGIAESRRMASDCIVRAKAALTGAGLEGRLGDIADWSLARQQ